jgi:hypothetical protein
MNKYISITGGVLLTIIVGVTLVNPSIVNNLIVHSLFRFHSLESHVLFLFQKPSKIIDQRKNKSSSDFNNVSSEININVTVNGLKNTVTIQANNTVVISWASKNVKDCFYTRSDLANRYLIDSSGSFTTEPLTKNISFRLTCSSPIGEVIERVTVLIRGLEPSVDLKVNGSDGPINVYDADQSKPLMLSWTSKNVTVCHYDPESSNPNIIGMDKIETSGTKIVTEPIIESGKFYVICEDDIPSIAIATDTVSVNLVPDPQAKPFKINFPIARSVMKKGSTYDISWSGYDNRFSKYAKYSITLLKGGHFVRSIINEIIPVSQKTISWQVPDDTNNADYGSIFPDSDYQIIFYYNSLTIATSSLFSIADTSTSQQAIDLKMNDSDGPITLSPSQGLTGSWVSKGVGGCVSLKDNIDPSGVEANGSFGGVVYPGHPFYPTKSITTYAIKCKKIYGTNISNETISDSVVVKLR